MTSEETWRNRIKNTNNPIMKNLPPPPPAQQEYICTEENVCLIEDDFPFTAKEIRTRPHTSTPDKPLPVEVCTICDIAVSCDRAFGR
jgi:hypothetical protein